MNFLENLFFGNVDPQARAVKTGSHADKLRTYITDHLPEIETALPDDQRGLLEKTFDAQSELDTITELDSFIVGFRLGAAFTYDTFVNMDTPYGDEAKAKCTFAKYKKCTAVYCAQWAAEKSMERLTVAV